MEPFRYFDTVHKPDGSLRSWKEHELLCKYWDEIRFFERYGYWHDVPSGPEAREIINREYDEKR